MIKPTTARNVPSDKLTLASVATTAGTASLLLATSIAAAEPQLDAQSLKMMSATPSAVLRTDLVVTNYPTVETGDAEYWEDPCGGPLPHQVVSMS